MAPKATLNRAAIIQDYIDNHSDISIYEYSESKGMSKTHGYLCLREIKKTHPELYKQAMKIHERFIKFNNKKNGVLDFSPLVGKTIRKPALIDWFIKLNVSGKKEMTCKELFDMAEEAGVKIIKDFYG